MSSSVSHVVITRMMVIRPGWEGRKSSHFDDFFLPHLNCLILDSTLNAKNSPVCWVSRPYLQMQSFLIR